MQSEAIWVDSWHIEFGVYSLSVHTTNTIQMLYIDSGLRDQSAVNDYSTMECSVNFVSRKHQNTHYKVQFYVWNLKLSLWHFTHPVELQRSFHKTTLLLCFLISYLILMLSVWTMTTCMTTCKLCTAFLKENTYKLKNVHFKFTLGFVITKVSNLLQPSHSLESSDILKNIYELVFHSYATFAFKPICKSKSSCVFTRSVHKV